MRKEYDFSQAKRGPVEQIQPGKTRITIRIDTDIVDWFRDQVNQKGGGNYQTMINDATVVHETARRSPGRDSAPGDSGGAAGGRIASVHYHVNLPE